MDFSKTMLKLRLLDSFMILLCVIFCMVWNPLGTCCFPIKSHDNHISVKSIEKINIEEDVANARQGMLTGVKNLQNLTEIYIEATLKQNLYRALRQLLSKNKSTLPSHIRGPYPSKLLKQFSDVDLLGAGDDAGPLDLVVTWTSLIFKQLLLVPNFFREAVRKNLTAGGASTGNSTTKGQKNDQKQKISLALRAQPFLNKPREIQILGIIANILSSEDVVPKLDRPIAKGDDGHIPSFSKVDIKNGGQDVATAELSTSPNHHPDIMHLKFGPKFVNQWRRLVVNRKFEDNFGDIFTNTRDAYELLDKLRSIHEQLASS